MQIRLKHDQNSKQMKRPWKLSRKHKRF